MLKVVETLDDAMELKRWFGERGNGRIALDTETSGVNVFAPDFKVRLVQFGTSDDAWVIPLERWVGLVDELCTGFTGRWIIHNSRFDITALAAHDIHVPWGRVDDTMIAMRLAEPTKPAGLKPSAMRHVSASAGGSQLDLHRAMKKNKWGWDTVPIDFPPYVFYAAMDTVITSRLFNTPACQRGIRSPVYGLEMEVRNICTTMETNGMRVNRDFCINTAEALRNEAEILKQDVMDDYGFSVTSNADLARWLMSNGAIITKTTDGGSPSVDKESLDEVVSDARTSSKARHVAESALRVRKVIKMASSYFDNFVNLADGDSVLHPSIETVAARTGRMSIREPALQTLPRVSDDPDSKLVRKAVMPREDGELLVSSDYEQIELRVVASLSKDPGLIEAFRVSDSTGLDFFTASARQVYDDDTIQKSDGRRPTIKSLFYAASYGAGVNKMAYTAGVSVDEMQRVKDKVFSRYPGMGALLKESENMCRGNDGWLKTEFGRDLWVDPDRAYAASNARIQGTAADVLKYAVVNLANAGMDEFMIVPVHDELLFSIPADQIPEANVIIAKSMADHSMAVPLLAAPSDGYITWGDVPK